MEEFLKYISDYGIAFIITAIVLFVIVKYGSKFLDITVDRLKNKNYMIDTLHEVVKNNTTALQNNSRVIENWTKNEHKKEQKIDILSEKIVDMTKEMSKNNTNIEIIKANCLNCKNR